MAEDKIGFSASEIERLDNMSRIIAEMDYISGMSVAKDRGLEEGKKEGKKEVAVNMINNSADDDFIMKRTHFSKEEIAEMRKEVEENKNNS